MKEYYTHLIKNCTLFNHYIRNIIAEYEEDKEIQEVRNLLKIAEVKVYVLSKGFKFENKVGYTTTLTPDYDGYDNSSYYNWNPPYQQTVYQETITYVYNPLKDIIYSVIRGINPYLPRCFCQKEHIIINRLHEIFD